MGGFEANNAPLPPMLSPSLDIDAWLHAIIDSSEYAILSKTLDGIITTWNPGATRLFEYTAEEAIGKPVTIVIPDERLHEEDEILRRLRAGERVEQFETVRRRKSGHLVDISLSATPIRNSTGEILGASKIARDISAEKTAKRQQELLLQEMRHRIKNLFSVSASLVQLSARSTRTVSEFAADLTDRLVALSRAHDLTLPAEQDNEVMSASLLAFLEAIVSPHAAGEERITITGDDASIGGNALTSMALIFHEFTTNAAKYGALSVPDGRLRVETALDQERLVLHWIEQGGPTTLNEPVVPGFGTVLERASLGSLKGTVKRSWTDRGLAIELRIPVVNLAS